VTDRVHIVSWNIENLVPALGASFAPPARGRRPVRRKQVPSLFEMASQFGSPDVLCLQEIRVRPQDDDIVQAMREALPGYVCHAALASDRYNARFRGGRAYGVATYVRADLPHELVPHPDWDREGRVCAIVLPEHGLLLGNVYAVNGTDRPHFDPDTGQVDGDRHDWKRRFQADLLQYLRGHADGRQLVLMGDWNISRSAQDTYPRLRTEVPHALARAMFNDTFMPALDLADAYRELHPEAVAYTWFNRLTPPGRLDAARVDFALVSRALLAHVAEASILDEPMLRFHSDHAPIRLVITKSAALR
jgi:exodeoxyribonuclease III